MAKKWPIILPLFFFLLMALAACRASSINTEPTPTPTPVEPTPTALLPTLTPTPTPTPTPAPPVAMLPDFVSVVEKVRPAVASLQVRYTVRDVLGRPFTEVKSGSGVILDPRGYLLTNNHVIEDAQSIEVSLPEGRSFSGQLVGADPLTDLAVVKIEGQDLPSVTFAAGPPEVGEWVIAVGNALALKGGPTVTEGIVSALGRSINIDGNDFYDLIQTSAAINPGNSGGPLVNLQGEVVGINSAKASAENIGYAISISTTQPVFQELLANGKVAWPYLGVSTGDVTPALAAQNNLSVEWGAVLSEVMRGFPASEAGLRSGDIVVAFQRQEVRDATQLIVLLRRYRAGDKVEIAYYRGQERKTVTLTLAPRPDNL